MRKRRFTEAQTVAILRQADSTSVGEVAKKGKVSEASIYAWRKHFGHLQAVDVARLKPLGLETSRPKNLLAEALMEINASSI